MWPFGFLNTELVEEVWNHQSWNAQQNNPYLLKTSMAISTPGIISINQAVNLTLTSRPSGPNSSWLCHATRQWRGNRGRSCGRGCGPEKKSRSSRRILNFEGMKAVCLVICAHFTYTSLPGYPQKDGLFHGNSIYKWMSWRYPHDLGNLHIDNSVYTSYRWYLVDFIYIYNCMAGGFNPSEKYYSMGRIIPYIVEKSLKPPTK